MNEFRQGQMVRVRRGPQQGKRGRIYGFAQPMPDFPGDPWPGVYAGIDPEWAPDVPEAERAHGPFRLSDIEPVDAQPPTEP